VAKTTKKNKTGRVQKDGNMHPATAIAKAFELVDGLSCVSLMKGDRVNDIISSGSLILDLMLGGGFQRGRIASIFGPEGCGKSTILQAIAISAQQQGVPVAWYDFEGSADPVYMRTQGINLSYQIKVSRKKVAGWFYNQPDFGEQAYKHILVALRRMPDVDSGPPRAVFLVDSFAAMHPQEVDAETGDGRLGSASRMHSERLRELRPTIRKKGVLLIGSNQMRADIGSWGAPSKEAAGNAIKFYSDYRILVSRYKIEEDKRDHLRVLNVKWRTLKNRAFVPLLDSEMRILLGRGIDKAQDATEFLDQIGMLDVKSGRRRIHLELPDYNGKFLDWKSFRRLVERPEIRSMLFSLLKDRQTYTDYFKLREDRNYFYDLNGEDKDVKDKIAKTEEEYEYGEGEAEAE
jgi:recombination protein RecA